MARVREGKRPSLLRHRGMSYRRIEHSHREHAFAKAWERENTPTVGAGLRDFGVVQALMFNQNPHAAGAPRAHPCFWWEYPLRFWITNKEAAIAATVIQWLGSNVGFDFLRRTLAACGYKVVRDPEWLAAPDLCELCKGRGRIARIDGRKVCGWCRHPWRNLNEVETCETA